MKKIVCLIFCLCLAFSLSVASFAAIDPYAYWYPNGDGTYGYDTEAYNHDYAADLIATSGVNLNAKDYWATDEYGTYYYDIDRFNADYDAAIAALNAASEPVPDPYPVEWPDEVIEDDTNGMPDESENTPVSDILEDGESNSELELGEDTPMLYSVNDMRSSDDTTETTILDGLKAVIRSVFGEYEPVMTTVAITETVDGETVTTLVDAVADGASGVDYEYLAGVSLFSIMLYCMFKLLGGILS